MPRAKSFVQEARLTSRPINLADLLPVRLALLREAAQVVAVLAVEAPADAAQDARVPPDEALENEALEDVALDAEARDVTRPLVAP